jgi:hypothetical protein
MSDAMRREPWRDRYPVDEPPWVDRRRFGGGFGLAGLEDGWVDPATGGFTGDSFGGPDFRPQVPAGGPHRGRGPKGYVRSDGRIREDVSDRLSEDPWLDASEIEVRVADGEVTLAGAVSSRDDRRRAEDLAAQAGGVRHVQNDLRVEDRDDRSPPGVPAVTGGSAPPVV